MSFKTASAILRGAWLIEKRWADAHAPMIMAVLRGDGSFAAIAGNKADSDNDKATEPKKVLSHRAGVVYQVNAWTNLSRLPDGSIAMLDIVGPVTKYGDMCAYGSVDHVATINNMVNTPNIKGIILNIDSPGGEAAGTADLADTIKAAGKKKPVIALINDGIAASAAMWVASAASEIYTTQKTDMVGSVGVYTTVADIYGYYAAQGLNVRDVYAPQSTDKNGDYMAALQTPPNDEPLKAELKVLAQEFIDSVARNRSGKIQGTDWQTGKMFYAKEAMKLGLIDGIKSFEQVVRRMDTLIKTKEQNSNTMAFEKTLAVAKAESFEVVDGGFLIEEAHLNSIEAAIEAGETAQASVTSLTEQLSIANTAKETAEASLVIANAKMAQLEKKDATVLSAAIATEDPKSGEKTGWDKYETSLDKEANRLRAL